MPCTKCDNEANHAIQIREGDPTRVGTKPDRSLINVVRLCDEHWVELREFLKLA